MTCILDITLLELPPTINHYYRTGRTVRYKTAEGKAFQAQAAAVMNTFRKNDVPYAGPVALHIIMTTKTRRKWDLDNRVKAVQDCLALAGVIEDDNQIDELVVRRESFPKLDRTRVIVMTREGRT